MTRSILRLAHAATLVLAILLAGCRTDNVVDVPSANQDGRVRFLVLHFTDENFARSLDLLTRPHDNPVSAHYLVSRAGEFGISAPAVLRLVDESRRAWHAGPSRWQGHESLNGESIGIEIVYESNCPRDAPHASPWQIDANCAYPDYPQDQIDAVIALSHAILERHPEIEPSRVVGHADIQPENKTDPGPRFPWRQFAAAGIGAWYDDATVAWYRERFATKSPTLKIVQLALAAYGYGVEPSGVDDRRTRDVLSAFQSHFLPAHRSGQADADSIATLFALLAKYRPDELRRLREREPELPPAP